MTFDLIKIETKDDKQLVNARELHTFLDIETKFKDWILRMLDYGFEENLDYLMLKNEQALEAERARKDYYLTINCAKEIAMIQRTDKGKKARQYFLECERKLKENIRPLSQTEILVIAAQRLLDIERYNKELEAKLNKVEQLAVEANSYNSSNTGFMTIRGFCNVHKIKLPLKESQRKGREASKLVEELGIITKKSKDELFGEVRSYPIEVLEEIFLSST